MSKLKRITEWLTPHEYMMHGTQYGEITNGMWGRLECKRIGHGCRIKEDALGRIALYRYECKEENE